MILSSVILFVRSDWSIKTSIGFSFLYNIKSSGYALGFSGWNGHISFEKSIPKNSSKPCLVGLNSSASPKCHLPKIPVVYPFAFNISEINSSLWLIPSLDFGPNAPLIPILLEYAPVSTAALDAEQTAWGE